MALTNNEKQIRRKQLEALKKYGNDVLLHLILSNSHIRGEYNKSNEELKAEIDNIVNLPNGWTDEDYQTATKKIENLLNETYENPHLLHNDINAARNIMSPNFDMNELRRAEYKAPETVRNIKAILKLAELTKSDQIAVVTEVMRQLARELLSERNIPQTFANATALSLIGHQYAKPEWVCNILARNLHTQCSREFTDNLIKELQNLDIKNGGIVFNE